MAVVVVVRHHHADFVQVGGPAQFPPLFALGGRDTRPHTVPQLQGTLAHTLSLLRIHAEALLQFAHRQVARVG